SQNLIFDHNHTFSETVDYLNSVVRAYPDITKLHVIGKSYLGKDLIVIEITNHETGDGLSKPGYWFDGNLHAGEVMGAEVSLKTIDVLVKQYGKDPYVTDLVDTRTIYIMPKLNPDGSDHYLTKPDGMRSSVRPHDSDTDGQKDEDPPDDLDGDGYILQMRVRDVTGSMKTSADDPRLLERCEEDEKGEWRVYSEGIDNDNDGRFNEDGVGGLDINRNWPAQWKQEYIQNGAGIYPLSEPETRSVAEFLFSHPNITGVVNHHMAGNFVYRPPTNRHFDPITGDEFFMAPGDESNYRVFGRKYTEIINDQRVQTVLGRGAPPRSGAIWGVMIGWAYDHLGVFSWVPEMGSYAPFCDYDDDGNASQLERLRWNDEELNSRIFVDWKPFIHPQLGQVEIGGFISKIYNDKYKTYNNMMCYPGPVFEDFLEKHAKWNLYLVSMSPLVRVTDVEVESIDSDIYKITAEIQNQGFLPTNVTEQAITNRTAKTVKAAIRLTNAQLVGGKTEIDVGHLDGNRSEPVKVEWIVKTDGRSPRAVIKAVSEKGGTDTKEIVIR
ncbi:M14 family metallopeptidase, partial [candidate division KSB1 bacterium]